MTVEENIITHPVPPRLLDTSKYPKPHIHSMDTYKAMWKESVEHPEEFFAKVIYILIVSYICLLYEIYSMLVSSYLGPNHLKLSVMVHLLMVILVGSWKVN